MTKSPNSGRTFLCFVLLPAITGASSEALHTLNHPTPDLAVRTLELDRRVSWREVDEIGPRCFSAHLPGPGTWLIELATSTPATTPELMLFAPPSVSSDDGTSTPRTRLLERIHSVMIEVNQAGDYVVCLTSQAPLGEVQLSNAFVAEIPDKGGDPDETEVEPEPAPKP